MAEFTKTLSGDSRYTLKLIVTETVPSDASTTNKTKVSWILKATTTSPYGRWDTSGRPTSVSINGTTVYNQTTPYDFRNVTEITLASGSNVEISHNDDGSKTIACSASVDWSDNNLGTATASGNLTLTTIPRASEPTCSNVTMGNAVTINTNRKSSSFTHTLQILVNNSVKETFTGIGASKSWTPAIATYAPLNTAGTTVTAVIKCTTYNGNTQVGTAKTCSVTLTIPNNSTTKPTASIAIAEANATMISKAWGVYVQGKSQLQVTLSGTAKYSASISSYSSTANGSSYSSSPYTTGLLSSSGTQYVKATSKDSRGFSSSEVSQSYSVVAYSNPTITAAKAYRTDSSGNESDEGTYLKYSFVASVSSVSNHNTAVYKIGYKRSTSSTYTYVTIASSGYTLNQSNVILSGVTLNTNYSYDIIFSVEDAFTTVTKSDEVPSGFDLMNFNASGKSMAIGKVSEASASEKKLEIALDTEYKGMPLLEYEVVDTW